MKYLALLALIGLAAAGDPSPTDDAREKFYNLEDKLWKNVTDPDWYNAGLGGDVELTKVFSLLADDVESLPRPPRPPIHSWLWSKAVEKLQIIDSLYKNFVEFVRRQSIPGAVPAPVKEWLDLAEGILMDPKTSAKQALRKLDDLLEHGDMFRVALQEEHPDLCDLQLSPHQLIYDMYNTISLTEIKGYAMMQFSWMLLKIYGKGNYTQEASLARQRYAERTAKTAAAARAALVMARRDLYRCDPPHHQEGVSYAEVTRLLQGYIENEVDMNPTGACKENCGFYTLTENHGCYKDQYCSKQATCGGRILECQYIDSDMWICPASLSSNRRYDWIEYENGRKLGRGDSCMRGTTKVDSWWQLWNLRHCSYCFCLCEDAAIRSERFFSLHEALTDLTKNKIVTGARLVKLGRVFHLQVSEGTLRERGKVENSQWVAVQRFDPNDPGVQDGTDFHTLTYEKRAIDLDEIDSPDGHILTGIRIYFLSSNGGGPLFELVFHGSRFRMHGPHLHFEIRSTPFNYTTGHLATDKSQWIGNDNTDGAEIPRSRLVLHRPDIPTRSMAPLPVDSKHDQYVEFTNSDLEADAAQSTVPFIDIQPVEPLKGGGLNSGAGIIHRGARGSGGYIALKLFTYDYSKHVKAEAPPSDFGDDTAETTEFMPIVN